MRTDQILDQSIEADEENEEAALDVKAFNREVIAALDERDRKGVDRHPPLKKWELDVARRIIETGVATAEQQCELAVIKATYFLTNPKKKKSKLPRECRRGWVADTLPALQALAVCQKALKNFDPAKGELAGYLYRIAEREVRKAAWEMFGTGKDMGYTGRGKDAAPVLLSRDDEVGGESMSIDESPIEHAISTVDVVSSAVAPNEIESARDLEIMRIDLAQVAPTSAVIDISQEAISAALEQRLRNISPEHQARLKRWKGVSDTADGEAPENLTVAFLAAESGISTQGMQKRLDRILQKARG
jgi:hypothetical protein